MTVDWQSAQRAALQKAMALIASPTDYQPVIEQQVFAGQQNHPVKSLAPVANSGTGFRPFFKAIRGQESGGNYGAVNSDSGALGALQVMPGNIPQWSQEALGHSITPDQFLASRHLQNLVTKYKLRQYFNQYGPAGAASAWYSGDPSLWNNKDSQGNYPSIYQYVQDILQKMGRGKSGSRY